MPLFIDTAGCDNWSADELISKTKLYLVVSSIVSLGSDNIAFIDFIAQYFLNLETLWQHCSEVWRGKRQTVR